MSSDWQDGRDWTTRRVGAVTDTTGDRVRVSWDPKTGSPYVRIDGDTQTDCTDVYWRDEPDDDGWRRSLSAFVVHLSPDEAETLAGWLTEAARDARAFFGHREAGE